MARAEGLAIRTPAQIPLRPVRAHRHAYFFPFFTILPPTRCSVAIPRSAGVPPARPAGGTPALRHAPPGFRQSIYTAEAFQNHSSQRRGCCTSRKIPLFPGLLIISVQVCPHYLPLR